MGETRKDVVPGHPLAEPAAFYEFNCTVIEVEVDRETGDTPIVRHVTVGDAGRSTRSRCRMQDEGAAIMGLGHTLMEHNIFDDRVGSGTSARSTTGSPPSWTCRDSCTASRWRTATGPGPTAPRGSARARLLCVVPAVAAAVRDVTGVPIRDLPLTPERVWRAINHPVPVDGGGEAGA